MREFERIRKDSAGTDHTEQRFPEDFSLEEAAFASELRELFPIEAEILPPQFIQTVIEDERCTPTPPGFEQKLTYNVFSRLSLPRGPLFPQQRTPWNNIRQALNRTSRPLAASLVAVALLMVFSVVMASPSFAAGMQLLLAHTGVRQVDHYPTSVAKPVAHRSSDDVTLTPSFQIKWLGLNVDKYHFSGARAIPGEVWSDGPIVEMQYSLGHESPGSGVINIREFKVASNLAAVLQVVQDGSTETLTLDGMPAVYINGAWIDPTIHRQPMMDTPIWQSGVRSELMLERDGVVFWIVGDQRDGANEAELVKLASMLMDTSYHILHPYPITLHGLGESFMQIFQLPRGHELLYLVPKGAALTSSTGIIIQSNTISY